MGDMSTQLPKWHVHLPSGGLKSGSRPPLRRRGASDALYGDDCGVYVASGARDERVGERRRNEAGVEDGDDAGRARHLAEAGDGPHEDEREQALAHGAEEEHPRRGAHGRKFVFGHHLNI